MNSPIGIFDSGYGGLTVLKSIKKLLPPYDYLYLGDNARAPYGSRSFDVVYQYTREAIQYLFPEVNERGTKVSVRCLWLHSHTQCSKYDGYRAAQRHNRWSN